LGAGAMTNTAYSTKIANIVEARIIRLLYMEKRYMISCFTVSSETLHSLYRSGSPRSWYRFENDDTLLNPAIPRPIKINNNLKLGAVGCEYE
jgi:hypothetical protein